MILAIATATLLSERGLGNYPGDRWPKVRRRFLGARRRLVVRLFLHGVGLFGGR